jgi:hypothetical protein
LRHFQQPDQTVLFFPKLQSEEAGADKAIPLIKLAGLAVVVVAAAVLDLGQAGLAPQDRATTVAVRLTAVTLRVPAVEAVGRLPLVKTLHPIQVETVATGLLAASQAQPSPMPVVVVVLHSPQPSLRLPAQEGLEVEAMGCSLVQGRTAPMV